MNESSINRDCERLIKRLKASGYIKSDKVERAMRKVPREEFVSSTTRRHAYRDTPLSIAHGQTISAPHMCAIMCEFLDLSEGQSVLDVGGGSGYHAALCAEIVAPEKSTNPGHVYTIEIVKPLVEFARENLERAGYSNRVTMVHGDGGKGLPEYAPFDRILVAAAAPDVPQPLMDQLVPGGIMLIPVGARGFFQDLMIVRKNEDSSISKKRWGGVAFVPMTGDYGH
ncbi:protein-L-isoaspartate(D-aspartate) O-methyltransferase [Candidatus Thorarchaeota archaeon]|nr:MAG: protein-L-isoaspartate(D-aspartate) O-methyltransferase [Candidatus Thorarchaeota archaeon]